MKRAFLTILVLMSIGILFRGWIYRHSITYKSIGQRQSYVATSDKLIEYYNINMDTGKDLSIDEIIKMSLSITSSQLNFTDSKNDNNPNDLINTKTAHCVGYASFFTTACNYLLKQKDLSDVWAVKAQPGQLYFLGTNIHNYFSSPFFKDHDFVTIENKRTGEIFSVDPTVNDYLAIDYITYKK